MKIVHVIPAMTWDRGGPAQVVAALARHQQRDGHTVTVLTTDQGSRRGERPIDLPDTVEMLRARVWGPDRVAYAPRFAEAARSQLRDADMMHVHSIFRFPCLAAVKAAAEIDRPLVIRPCGVLHRYGLQKRSSLVKQWFLRRYGPMYRTACKAWHYTSVNERRDSWPFEHVAGFVAPNGIDVEQYAIDRDGAYEAVVSEWPECAGYRYVLFLGRLHAKKRLDLLLEAFLEAAPNTHKLVIAGPDEGGLWNDLAKRFLTRPEHRQRVIRVGLVTGAKKSRLLAGASLFALASEHENFGNAVLESLAAGTPVLGSSHVDLVTELASEGLAEVADLNLAAWKDQLSSLLPRPPSEEFVQTARHWIAEHYGWDHVAKLIAREYESLT